MQALLLQAYIGSQLAQWVHDVRTRAGLSQRQLAERIGSSQPAIARLEDARYTGHSLKVVTRIAVALNESLVIDIHPQRYRGREKRVATGPVYASAIGEGGRRGTVGKRAGKPRARGRRTNRRNNG